MARAREEQPAHLVTTAAPSPEADRREREKRYLILMGLRVVAIIAAIVVGRLAHLGALVVPLVIAAMALPWIAVVIANAGPRQQQIAQPSLWSLHRRRLGPGKPPSKDAA